MPVATPTRPAIFAVKAARPVADLVHRRAEDFRIVFISADLRAASSHRKPVGDLEQCKSPFFA